MAAWLINQWQRNGPWQFFLRPVSWIFGLLLAIRRAAFRIGLLKSHLVGVPVVIVGNITVGGTGKTPLVLALVQALTRRGRHCGIVTRGYNPGTRGSGKGNATHVPSAKLHRAEVGDEAILLANRSAVPVYASVNRVDAAQTLLRNHPDVDVIVSDDGLQHYGLQRDVEICVIDGSRGLGNGRLLPAGPLREPASRLNTVDAIALNLAREDAQLFQSYSGTPVFEITLTNELFINLATNRCISVAEALAAFSGMAICAVAGIGHPQRFFSHLTSLGFTLGTTRMFADHHRYRAEDMPGLQTAIILMTEKDAVKCGTFADQRMWFMRVDAAIPEVFIDFVLDKLIH